MTRRHWVLLWVSFLGLALIVAQDTLDILNFDVASTGDVAIEPETDPAFYYVLRHGDHPGAIGEAVDIMLAGEGILNDQNDPDTPRAFYQVVKVPVADPQDTDGDGMDDVFELNNRLSLNALDDSDASADFDADGRPNLKEYREGSDHEDSASFVPMVPILDPTPVSTELATIPVTGRSDPNVTVQIVGGASPLSTTTAIDGTFSFNLSLKSNSRNRLFAHAENQGLRSAPQSVDVIQDTQSPTLFIDFPSDGMEITTESVVIAGRVADALSGFMGLEVEVQDQPANVIIGIGTNGTYERPEVPLEMGPNQIVVRATDELGNTLTKEINLTRITAEGTTMTIVSGNGQVGMVTTELPEPVVIKIANPDGSPFANKVVTFAVTRSNGTLATTSSASTGQNVLQVSTDAQGHAQAYWTMGMDAGCGNNRLSVTSESISGTVFFCASAEPFPARQINVGSGGNQRAEVDGPAVEPLRAWVNDSCNGVSGVPVTFTVTEGGGKVNGEDSITVTTLETGHAEVDFTLGPDTGNNRIQANFAGNTNGAAEFVVYGLQRRPLQPTAFSGLVLNNAFQPVGGATCVLEVDGTTLPETVTSADGQFTFSNIPSGPGHLHIDGLPATLLNGQTIPAASFPALAYEVLVVPNSENTLPAPVLLPALNPNNAVDYDGTRDVILKCEGIEGLQMTVKAGSMRRADGSTPSPSDPAVLTLNQVHHDDIPMPMPDGAAPPFAWTLQPAGATFDPPIDIEYPNMSGLPPGAIAYFLSFDHDVEEFQIVATGAVSEDGSTVVSDPGVGLSKAGWGCNCPPYSVTGSCERGTNESSASGESDDAGTGGAGEAITNAENLDTQDTSGSGSGNGTGENIESTDEEGTAGDPVILSSGELVVTEVDLSIPGRGFSFQFKRTYRSRFNLNGPLGHNWDFTYNRRLFEPSQSAPTPPGSNFGRPLRYCNGLARIDTYWFDSTANKYESPPGFYEDLLQNADGTFTIRDRHGFKTHFDANGFMTSQVDRMGNTMRFVRDATGTLTSVIDTLGRTISFAYNDKGRLKAITDFAGREVLYTYDAAGDLRAVRSPVVTGTSIGNDFSNGKTTRYEYDTLDYEFPLEIPSIFPAPASLVLLRPPSDHNLTAIQDGKGQFYLRNTYEKDPNSYEFDRVVRQQWGDPDQVCLFSYEELNPGVIDPTPDTPKTRTTKIDRNGNRRITTQNSQGKILEDRAETNRNVNPEDPNTFVTTHTYNRDGERLSTVFPEGNSTSYTFDSSNTDRLQQGNLLEVTYLPGPRGGDQAQRQETYSYEPIYNQVRTYTEERGNDSSFTPPNGGATSATRYTTTHTFDYQEGSDLAGLATVMGRSEAEVTTLLASASVATGLGDVNGDGSTSQRFGNIIQRQQPTVTLLADSLQASVEGDMSQEIITDFAYNRFGQRVSQTDPEGNVSEFIYHPESDPDGDGTPTLGAGLAGDTGGYVFAVVKDSQSSPRRRSTRPLEQIRTERLYDPVGNLTTFVDGRGNDTLYEVNALNQVVRMTSEAPERYETFFYYDANNNLLRKEIENRDTNGPDLDGSVTYTYEYDILDNRLSETSEVSTAELLVTGYAYDRNENLTRVTQPEGNSVETVYDERDLVYSITRGAGSPKASTRTFTYDGNQNLVREIDAVDNNGDGTPESTVRQYDGYDRLVVTIDAVGGQARRQYDPAGHLINLLRIGQIHGPSPTDASGSGNANLARTEMKHDELGREYEMAEHLFTLPRPNGVANTTVRKVITHYEYDRSSRRTRNLDDNGHHRRFDYDGLDRLVAIVDQLGNEQQFTYDGNDNRIQMVEVEKSPEGLVPDETFTTIWEYDELDRLEEEIDNLNNRTLYAYDSRNNVILKTDQMGNTTTFIYDGLNRQLEEIVDLRVGGTGAGAIDTSNPENPDGQITTLTDWDGNSRLAMITDDNGNPTQYAYDDLNRLETETFADSTTKSYVYDADDNLATLTDQNGSVFTNVYDALHRRTSCTIARAANVIGTTEQRFEYDGLSRRTFASDNNDPTNSADDSQVEFHYDSLSRLVGEIQNGVPIRNAYDGVGNRVACTYPNGRVIESAYDGNDRLERIQELVGSALIAEYDYLGPARVLERRYGNGSRLRFHDGNGNDVGYDGLKRRILQRHETAAGVLIAGFSYAFDRAHNRRFESDLATNQSDAYEYDSSYRLARAALEVPSAALAAIANNNTTNADIAALSGIDDESFMMDGVGNWTTQSKGNQTTTYDANEMNEYVAVGPAAQRHDHNGNLTSDGTRLLDYDALNRLNRIRDVSGTTIATYVYDAAGRRIAKSAGGSDTLFYYDRARAIEERDDSAQTLRQYVYGIGIDEVLQISSSGQFYYYQESAIGSVAAISDTNGTLVERYRYTPYGQTAVLAANGVTIREVSVLGNPFQYTGRRIDSESGLYYYRARCYDPVRGRFLQRDPKGYIDGMGLYNYVANNPANWIDPFGAQKSKSAPIGEGGVETPFRAEFAAVLETLAMLEVLDTLTSSESDPQATYHEWKPQSSQSVDVANIVERHAVDFGIGVFTEMGFTVTNKIAVANSGRWASNASRFLRGNVSKSMVANAYGRAKQASGVATFAKFGGHLSSANLGVSAALVTIDVMRVIALSSEINATLNMKEQMDAVAKRNRERQRNQKRP